MQRDALPPQLVAASTIISRGDFSESYFYNLVKRGEFPAPVMKAHRLTRWLGADVDEWFSDPSGWMAKHHIGAEV